MSVLEHCTKDIVAIEADAPVERAAQVMRECHIGCLVVVRPDNYKLPVGIITDRDIVNKAVADGLSLDTPVESIMSPMVVTVKRGFGLADVIRKMEISQVRRIVVVDDNGEMCGLISTDDIFQVLAAELNSLGHLFYNQVRTEAYAYDESPLNLE